MDPEDFFSIFGSEQDVSYGKTTLETVKHNRSQLGDELFIDKLLKHIKLNSASKIYPPRSNRDLRDLFKEIVTSSRPVHDQHSLVYYITRDLRPKTNDYLIFAEKVSLPNQYRVFMDGLWFLDRLRFEEAVECLTEPCLMPTFAEEILETLLIHSPRQSHLGLAYYHVVQPQISRLAVLDLLVDAMCRASLIEAFFTSRAYSSKQRRHFFEGILSFVHSRSPGPLKIQLSTELVGLPLDGSEEQWLENFLTYGHGQQLQGALDTMIMRQIVMGRTEEATRLAHSANQRNVDGMDWHTLTQSLQG